MRKRITGWIVVLGWLGVVGIAANDGEARLEYAGVVVEEVGKGSALEKAELLPGDVVYSWTRLANPPANPEPESGEILSPFDWMWLEIEQAPRGTVQLAGQRGGEGKVFEVVPGKWGATVRPRMAEEILKDYVRGKELVEAEEIEAGVGVWRKLAGAEENQAADGSLRCWLLFRIGDTWGQERQWEKAHRAYRSALEATQTPIALVAIWQAVGDAYRSASVFETARKAYESAQEIRESSLGEGLALAKGLDDVGILDAKQGRIDSAQKSFQSALEIRNQLAPGSLDVASSLNELGILVAKRGDLDRATEYFEGSLEIRQKLAPGSIGEARILNGLGILAVDRGYFDRAAEYYEGSLKITQKLSPGIYLEAAILQNLGLLVARRGSLEQAADYFEESLEIYQKVAPGSMGMASNIGNQGLLAFKRGQLDRAAEYYGRAMEMYQKVAPGSLAVVAILNNLGLLASSRGELDRAVEYYEESLEISQKVAPGSLKVAGSLGNLGVLAVDRGDLDRAAEYYEGSLEISQRLAPSGLYVANSMNRLGRLALDRGDLDQAAEHFVRNLEIIEKLAPGSSGDAKNLHNLATVRRRQNQAQSALSLFLQVLQVHESQISRLGGSRDVQANFHAKHVTYYRDTIDLSLKLRRRTEAFHILERSRAQAFLAQLAERDLVFSDIPEELGRQRRRIAHRYDQIQAEIAQLNTVEQAEEIKAQLTRLQQLRRDYEDVTEKIVKASPRLGALRYPTALDLTAARQALDPGTVMLSYSVGEDETHLFALTQDDGLEVKTLPVGEEELREQVERVLELQKRRSAALLYTQPLRQAGERLYQALILPVEESIAKSDRVLIVPDGPLHLLPFALLVRKTGPGERDRDRDFEYLVEWKPLHSALSATVYAELKSQRRSQPDEDAGLLALAAFGDPRYPFEGSRADVGENRNVDVYVRAAAERGFDFRPLPYSREEVSRITGLYPEGAARAFLGAEASEEGAKAVGKSARILHFAAHGRFDDQIPLNSYLALTIPEEFREGQENGLLQAWEIFEDVRIDADLVVLSACESGVGAEIDGEGLKGLTRAFQFAGARTVASSLWQVDDQATAELMQRFYRHLRAGMAKDEALRAAQLELIRGPIEIKNRQGQVEERDLSSPYYWAAFQLIGDWR